MADKMKGLTAQSEAIYDGWYNVWKCDVLDKAGKVVQVGSGETKADAERAAKLIAAADDILAALTSFLASMHGKEEFAGHHDAYRQHVCLPRGLEAFQKAGDQSYSYYTSAFLNNDQDNDPT